MMSIPGDAAHEAVRELLTRITSPSQLHKTYLHCVFQCVAQSEFSANEVNDLHALSDFLIGCHALPLAEEQP